MLQSDYDNLQLVPVYVVLGLVFFISHVVVIYLSCRSPDFKPTPLVLKLASAGFKILFSNDEMIKAQSYAFGLEPSPTGRDFSDLVPVLLAQLISYAQLPVMFMGIAIAEFWMKFIIYETDSGCNPNDLSLECFSNSSGPLPCGSVLELKNSTYVCYKLSFNVSGAAASMVGVASIAVIFNAVLAKYFTVVRYICHRCCDCYICGMLATEIIQLFTGVANYVLWVVYIVYGIKEPEREVDQVLQAVFTAYLIYCCCACPWAFIEPSDNDEIYELLPCLRRSRSHRTQYPYGIQDQTDDRDA